MSSPPSFHRTILDSVPGTLACGAVLTVVLAVVARVAGGG